MLKCGTDDQEDHDDHDDDVEFVGTSNGTKSTEQLESAAAEKDEGGDGDKPAADDTTEKEPEPDFTVTPSKDGQLLVNPSVNYCIYASWIFMQIKFVGSFKKDKA